MAQYCYEMVAKQAWGLGVIPDCAIKYALIPQCERNKYDASLWQMQRICLRDDKPTHQIHNASYSSYVGYCWLSFLCLIAVKL